MSRFHSLLQLAARADRLGFALLRAGLVTVLVWIKTTSRAPIAASWATTSSASLVESSSSRGLPARESQ